MSAMEVLSVNLGERSYDVVVGEEALTRSGERLADLTPRGKAFIAADKAAMEHHGARLLATLEAAGITRVIFQLEGGEAIKSWTHLAALVDWMIEQGMERGDNLIAFGGGTVGDLAGFAVATMKRGCGFIQIPTTLLAQVDSSVGGKTGINTKAGKNLAGAFYQPRLVIADTSLLATLPRRERLAGYAEIVKAGLIADLALFERLEALGADTLSGEPLVKAIAASIAFKARIVEADEREGGVRGLLNLGHTFGHAFEAEAKPGELIHGEAVAVGMVQAFAFSERLGVCVEGAAQRVEAHLQSVGLPFKPDQLAGGPYQGERLLARMAKDKKNSGGSITLILAHGLGKAYIAPGADRDALRTFLIEDLKR